MYICIICFLFFVFCPYFLHGLSHFRLPYGRVAWVSLLATVSAYVFFMISAFHCSLMIGKVAVQTAGMHATASVFLGYWSRDDSEMAIYKAMHGTGGRHYCVRWSSTSHKDIFDGTWRFGRMVGIVGCMIGFGLICFGCYILIWNVTSKVLLVLTILTGTMSVLSLLLLTGLRSDVCINERCHIGPAGALATIDCMTWIAATILLYMILQRSNEMEADEKKRNYPLSDTTSVASLSTSRHSKIDDVEKNNHRESPVCSIPVRSHIVASSRIGIVSTSHTMDSKNRNQTIPSNQANKSMATTLMLEDVA